MDVSNRSSYTPRFNGNRDLPEGEQFRVKIESLSTWESLAVDQLDKDDIVEWAESQEQFQGKVTDDDWMVYKNIKVVDESVVAWKGLSIKGEAVQSVWDLFKLPIPMMRELVAELSLAAAGMSEEDLKNLDTPSAGSSGEDDATAAETDNSSAE